MKRIWKAVLLVCITALLAIFPVFRQSESVSASAASGDVIAIEAYHADLTVQTNRKIVVKEQITVKFLKSGLTMFYRSLPKEKALYSDISASCAENPDFSYEVADNPDIEDFLDINCIGGAEKGNTWTYEVSFTMENGADTGDRLIVDVISYGFTVALHNVSVDVHFPAAISENDYATYVGFGSTEKNPSVLTYSLSQDKKTLSLAAELLPVTYVSDYEEYCAQGITLDFTLPKGTLQGYLGTRIFTENIAAILLCGVAVLALAFVVRISTRKKQEIVTIVNLKAPDDMDPMEMGVVLDGSADSEDVTSMIYYFAHKGYLTIDFTNEDDPILRTGLSELPQTESAHAQTLFEGLFSRASWTDDVAEIAVSELANHFYKKAEEAKLQVLPPKMYDKKSVLGFAAGGVLGALFAFLAPFITGLVSIGGGYTYPLGALLAVPILGILVLAWINENYRYKWKSGKRFALQIAQYAVVVVSAIVFCLFIAGHILTGFEKAVVCAVAFLCVFITRGALSRREDYCMRLGHILGFKDFIVVTEEEKIEFMLKEDPTLYYKVLPYAQVLGVTDEWEEKFKRIVIEPPTWYTGADLTFFDYMILNRCMTRAITTALSRPDNEGGGSFMGRSGGGGGFGGFGGGGFGGGGGGAR